MILTELSELPYHLSLCRFSVLFKEHRYIELFLNSTAGGGSGMGGYGREGMGMLGSRFLIQH